MDQQQLASMDPKLREAYDRIMGNTTKPGVQASTQAQQTMNPAPTGQLNQPPTQPTVDIKSNFQSPPIQTTTPQQTVPPPPPSTPNTAPPPQFIDPVLANNQMHAYVAQEVAGVKQSLKIIQIMYIAGGLVFFAVYALFWMKFFNISAPF